MKILALLLILIAPLQAQIFADFETSAGNFTVELYQDKAPKAVANFIGLATGSRPWIDSLTGEVRNTPFYEGITFHRVIDGFMNQFGSLNGQGTDGPGYSFRDEFDPTLNFSNPYQLAMANSGPNTNGSQLFITVSPQTLLNNVHTIFGIVPDDGTSRQTIDAINTAPKTTAGGSTLVTPITISKVTIRRVGTNAQNFDETAQELPIPTIVQPKLPNATTLQMPLENNSVLSVHSSTNLTSWNFIGSIYYGPTTTLPTTITLPDPIAPRAFYRPTLVLYPDAPNIPLSLESGTTINITSTLGTTNYTFTSSGAGTFTHTNSDTSTETGTFTGSLTDVSPIKAQLTLIPQLQNDQGNDVALQTIIYHHEGTAPSQMTGSHKGNLFARDPTSGNFQFSNSETGIFTLTLP